MTVFLLSVVASIIGAFLYALIFSKNEEKVRLWLSKLRSGWLRKRFVWAFVGAVRGKARETDTAAVNYLLLIFPLLVGLIFGVIGSQADLSVARSKVLLEGVKESESQLRANLAKSSSRLEAMSVPNRITEYAALVWAYVMLIGIIPFRVFRSRFSYDLDRLLDYLRTIATTDEIVALMLEEKKVTNEATLKTFAMS
jgi:beta-lactamase regulating signal transducer with metallopeptidase domain